MKNQTGVEYINDFQFNERNSYKNDVLEKLYLFRVCGRADTILSQIILDNTAAAEQIPKDTAGRFILHDGTVFQAFWIDESDL